MTVSVRERPRKLRRLKHDFKGFSPYDWKLTHSYTATNLFAVIGGRSTGKTYGLRLECIEDYWKRRERFVEIVRAERELAPFAASYFSKIDNAGEFPDLIYKTRGNLAYIAERKYDGSDPDWELAGYFVAIDREQDLKKLSSRFDYVRNFVFDEAVIDRSKNPHMRYRGDEFSALMGIMNTVLRETPDKPAPKARMHLIGNACDLTCPLFRSIGVDKLPEYGKHFYGGKLAMLDYVKNENAKGFREQTTVGRLMGLTDDAGRQAGMFFDNVFLGEYSDFIERKPPAARLIFTITFGRRFGLWLDSDSGLTFVTGKSPKGSGKPEFVLVRSDMRIDYIQLDKSTDLIKRLKKYAKFGLLRYEDAMTAADFSRLLEYIGAK